MYCVLKKIPALLSHSLLLISAATKSDSMKPTYLSSFYQEIIVLIESFFWLMQTTSQWQSMRKTMKLCL